ncbi:hypothetical protein Pfo_015435 [Paulownia fortunei]|nr:hypothetical protein Pfo_015435 [Paulownia fortunei]
MILESLTLENFQVVTREAICPGGVWSEKVEKMNTLHINLFRSSDVKVAAALRFSFLIMVKQLFHLG